MNQEKDVKLTEPQKKMLDFIKKYRIGREVAFRMEMNEVTFYNKMRGVNRYKLQEKDILEIKGVVCSIIKEWQDIIDEDNER